MDVNTIGERIRHARTQKGLTQAQLASALGCKYQTISNYENGKRSVDSATLKQICIVLGIKPIDIILTPVWDKEMYEMYQRADTRDDKVFLFEMWGVPSNLLEEYNELIKSDSQINEKPSAEGEGLEIRKLVDLFKKIPKENQGMVLAMIEAALNTQGLL